MLRGRTSGPVRVVKNLLKNRYAYSERKSYREELDGIDVLSPEDAMNLYLDFIKECPGSSSGTRRKMRKRLGL
jgi:hypothetical protein